ncbi:MAG TPA: FG-GAP repeat protein [Polyangiaceae bacterium LLY-WYZ-14_1]|nr:FG-GAP repeat protein [Polyangiaceae bacterium LLY-WYZ-14_1]
MDGNSPDDPCSIALGVTCAQFEEAYLKASNTDGTDDLNDHFGLSVALDGDTLAVGASGEDSRATGVDGDQTDNGARAAGAVYVRRIAP